ncbi:hypothetical protein ACVVIH_07300 [Chryseobacterium arthrosphaerae]
MKELKLTILSENPFSTDYNAKEFEAMLNDEEIDNELKDLISFNNLCNKFFFSNYAKMIKVFQSLALRKAENYKLIFLCSNYYYLLFNKQKLSNLKVDVSKSINLESAYFNRVKFDNGSEIKIKDGFERGGDVINELFLFLYEFEEGLLGDNELSSITEHLLTFYISKLWESADSMFVWKSYHDIVKYEGGLVTFTDDHEIKIKKDDEHIVMHTLEDVAEIREANHFNEFFFGIKHLIKKENKPFPYLSYNIEKNKIIPTIGYRKNEDRVIQKIAHTFKSKISYKSDGVLSYEEFVELISYISELVNDIANDLIKKDFSVKNIFLTIELDLLRDKISEITKIHSDIVNLLFNAITEKSKEPYFWKRLLFVNDGIIYLSFSLWHAPNIDLLYESFLKFNNVKLKERVTQFIAYVVDDLSEVKFSKVIYNDSDDFLVLESKSIKVIVYIYFIDEFQIEIAKNQKIIEEIASKTQTINGDVNQLNEQAEKPFFAIILTNYSKYAGLVINDVPILDLILLKNYYVTGAFQKGQVKRSKNKIKSKIANSLLYYNDEEDFNNNLVNFLYYPVPIYEIKSKLFWKETSVFPKGFDIDLIIDTNNYEDNVNIVNSELALLKTALSNKYLLNLKGKSSDFVNRLISFRLSNVIIELALGDYDNTSFRYNIIEIFSSANMEGLIHLIANFRLALNNLDQMQMKPDSKYKSINYNADDIGNLFERIYSNGNLTIGLTSLDISNLYSKEEEKKMLSSCIDIISTITTKKYRTSDIENYILSLSIIKNLKNKYGLDHYFYLGCHNLISALNHNSFFQQARNLAEEVFSISFKEGKEYRGWGILFLCYDQQRNVFNSTLYGCLYLNSLATVEKLPYSQIIDIFYSILKYSRNLQLFFILDDVFNFIKKFKLQTYDQQKIHLTYFLSSVQRTGEERSRIIEDSITYFDQNVVKILRFKTQGIVPWLNYFYNLKRIGTSDLVIPNVDKQISLLEEELDGETISFLKSKHFFNSESKKIFIENLKKTFSSYYADDFVYEIINLELESSLLIQNGIEINDFESILLGGLVNNDVRLIFNDKNIVEDMAMLFENDPKLLRFDNYLKFIIDNVKLKKGQLFIYLFNYKHHVYYLKINDQAKISLEFLNNWNVDDSKNFLKNEEKFYYDANRFFGIEDQEIRFNFLLDKLKYTSLNIEEKFDELLISTNIDLSNFPINLIENDQQFIGVSTPVTNILLLEWFIENNKFVIIDKPSLSCWIPIEDGDPTINMGYDKLKPVLIDYNIETHLGSIPDTTLDKDINIFFAHGELDDIGFKAVSMNEEKFVINNKIFFGKGKVAILFICHSGSLNESLFSNKIQSLIYELILFGYESVIAPFWSLEATIPSFWLRYFLENLNEGYTVSESVYLSNNRLAKYHEEISGSYYVPEGRLAMHLYGNPNIKLS